MTRVLCAQLAPRIADLPHNRKISVEAVRGAADRGADVVVLPELVTSGYHLTPEELDSVALGPEDELFRQWGSAAPESVVVGGFCERGSDGLFYNSAVVVDRGEPVAVYRKTHLWNQEKLLFAPGGQPPPVVNTSRGRIGVLICYDLEFPELTRRVALEGAELLAVPTNWPWLPRPQGEHVPEVVIAMAAARVNRVGIACCARSGQERGGHWNEASCVIGPDGWIRADVDDEGTSCADLDLAATRDKRLAERADLFGDRRPELYGPISGESPASRS